MCFQGLEFGRRIAVDVVGVVCACVSPNVNAGRAINRRLPMKMKLLAFLCLCVVAPASASTLYDNGPINGSYSGIQISTEVISDSFTLSSASTLTGAQVGLWLYPNFPGGVPIRVDWQLGSTPGASNFGSGTSLFTNTFLYNNGSGYNIYQSDFAITGSLSAGTYFFSLDNGYSTSGLFSPLYWDINNGPSTAYDNGVPESGFICPLPDSCSNSFQIYGSAGTSTVPEPSSLLLLGSGLLGIGGIVRRKLFS